MNARPGDDEAPSTWVPVESAEPGTQPAWLPPGTHSGQPYGPPPGQPYGQQSGRPYGQPYGGPPSYGAQPPPYGTPPPYGAQPGRPKPRMPRWAKVVLVVGVVFYVLLAIWQGFSILVLRR
ncbi:MAG: hypothetical protein ACRDP6_34620 [Actinoallomurus sp.]